MAMRIGFGEKELIPILKKDVRDASRVIERIDSATESVGSIWQHTLRGAAGGAGLGLIFEQAQYGVLTHLPNFISSFPLIQHAQNFFSSAQNDVIAATFSLVFAGAVGGILTFVNNAKHEVDKFLGKKEKVEDSKYSKRSTLFKKIANNAIAGIGIGVIGEQIAEKFVLQNIHYISNLHIFDYFQKFFASQQNDFLAMAYSATIAGVVGILVGAISAFAKKWEEEGADGEKTKAKAPAHKAGGVLVAIPQKKISEAQVTFVSEKRAA